MSKALSTLQETIATLLGPKGCPWDKEQTPTSLCEYILEESYELVEAIRHGSVEDVCEEMGDVFFLLALIATQYSQKNEGKTFTLEDALTQVAAKMIRRHPHVFADTTFDSREEQLKDWERIKREEHKDEIQKPKGIFHSLPKGLPALIKAYRLHSKAARVGFTWDSDADVEEQFEIEWVEFVDALQRNDPAALEHELGDMLFTLVELGRRKGIKANAALDGATTRFLQRFEHMEKLSAVEGKEFTSLSMEEKNILWDKAKIEEKK